MNPTQEPASLPSAVGGAAERLAVLQAYPLGTLQVKVVDFAPFIKSVLVGIDLSDKMLAPCIVAHYNASGIYQGCGRYKPEQVTPYLLDFDALTSVLGDGTVPAVEVAKLLINDWSNEFIYRIADSKSPTGKNFSVHIFAWTTEVGEVLQRRLSFMPDWNWLLFKKWSGELDHLENIGEAIDYLRGLGFALPVNGRPLIAGRDFIRKEPANG